MYKALHLSPMIPSYDMHATARFFMEVFDFKEFMNTENYAILCRQTAMIHILQAGSGIGEMEFYLEVDDVDSLWASVKGKIAGIRVKEPFDQVYGMREFHIDVPHTKALMFVGHELKA